MFLGINGDMCQTLITGDYRGISRLVGIRLHFLHHKLAEEDIGFPSSVAEGIADSVIVPVQKDAIVKKGVER